MEKNKKMTTIIVAGVLLLTVIGVTVAYFAVSVINGTRQNLSATTVESVNLTLDDNDAASYSGQVSFGSTITRNLKLTNEGGPTKVALYFQDLINTYTAGAFTYTLSYAAAENGSYTAVATDVAIPRRSKASSTAKITEIEMPATTTRYYRIVITYNSLDINQTRDLTAQFNTGFTIRQVYITPIASGNYLKDFCEKLNGNYGSYCSGESYNEYYILGNSNLGADELYKVDTIYTVDSKTPEAGTTYVTNGSPWDVSAQGNGSVMAWVTPHKAKKIYDSLSECNTALSNGTVTKCEEKNNASYYKRKRVSTGSYASTVYDSLAECEHNINFSTYTCEEQTANAVGYSTSDSKYDLYIGQDGGVVANPSSAYAFSLFEIATKIDLTNFNTEYVTDMSYMFYSSKAFIVLSNMDTSNVDNMSHMFQNNVNTIKLNINTFNTSNVTNMSAMFTGCTKLTELNINNLDTSNVTDMGSMFSNCTALTSLNLSNFDTANVTSFWGTFSECNAITAFNLSNFDTSNVTNMSYMFSGCRAVTSLDLSNFDTGSVTTMEGMFRYLCNSSKAITSLDLSHFDTLNVTNMNSMFYNASITTVRFDKANFDALTYNPNQPPFAYSSITTVYLNTNAKNYYNSHWSGWLWPMPMTIIEV